MGWSEAGWANNVQFASITNVLDAFDANLLNVLKQLATHSWCSAPNVFKQLVTRS